MLPTDVADAGQVENAAQQVEEKLGPIDIWINDAMTSVFSPIKEMTAEEFERVTKVTYLGYRIWNLGSAEVHVATRPRHHRSCRIGSGISQHSASGGLLCLKARDHGFLCLLANRSCCTITAT